MSKTSRRYPPELKERAALEMLGVYRAPKVWAQQAIWTRQRDGANRDQFIHHSDACSTTSASRST